MPLLSDGVPRRVPRTEIKKSTASPTTHDAKKCSKRDHSPEEPGVSGSSKFCKPSKLEIAERSKGSIEISATAADPVEIRATAAAAAHFFSRASHSMAEGMAEPQSPEDHCDFLAQLSIAGSPGRSSSFFSITELRIPNSAEPPAPVPAPSTRTSSPSK